MKQTWLKFFEVSLLLVCNKGVINLLMKSLNIAQKLQNPNILVLGAWISLNRWRRHLAFMWPYVPRGLFASGPHLCVEQGLQLCQFPHTHYRDQMREQVLKCFETIECFTVY